MKIIALTDIHGGYKNAYDIIEKEAADVVIIGGDLTAVGSVKEAMEVIHKFQNCTSYLLCVAGNMDTPEHDDLFDRLGCSINGKGIAVNDIGIFGVSAAPYSRLQTPYEISESEIARRLNAGFNQVKNCRIKISVSHAPRMERSWTLSGRVFMLVVLR